MSLFALQFARTPGARVIATTGSPEKAARLLDLGADEVIAYRAVPDWPARVRELTGGRGADHVIDVAGLLEQSLKAVAMAGHVACVGFLSGTVPLVDARTLFASGATVRAVAVGSRAQFLAMNRAIEVNDLHPVIDPVFPFEQAHHAYRYHASGTAFGKVVITI